MLAACRGVPLALSNQISEFELKRFTFKLAKSLTKILNKMKYI